MVSRRKFFSIFIMMAVLLFMFQFSHIVRENSNSYKVNQYAAFTEMNGSGRWNSETGKSVGTVAYVGATDSDTASVVRLWGEYTKHEITECTSLKELDSLGKEYPKMLLLDGSAIDYNKDFNVLNTALDQGCSVVFCKLPDMNTIREQAKLRVLLGIDKVQDKVHAKGITLFDGFLLGGEAIYQPSTEKEEKYQNMELDMPWYILGKGTKTYMVGLMDEKEVEREEFPALIWSHKYLNGKVFAVNGSYLEDETGLGILSAMDYEANEYVLYPVVNARSYMISDFPGMACEDSATMQEYYSRDADSLYRDVIWPGIMAMATQNEIRLTAFLSTKYNYDDEAPANERFISFYLQQLSEIKSEAGKSYHYTGNTSLLEKAKTDKVFYEQANNDYDLRTAFFQKKSDEIPQMLWEDAFADIKSAAFDVDLSVPVVSYVNDRVTGLRASADADSYSYMDDLRVRSVLSGLGYSNTLITMHNVLWPESKEDRWENYFDTVISNVTTFWNKGVAFDSATLSECDYKARTFLNLQYEAEKKSDVIEATISNVDQDAWFVLRTHGQDIVSAEKAEFTKLEQDAYLIHALGEKMSIKLGKSGDILEYSTTKGEE